MTLLIYTIQVTSRLQYIADLIFRDLLEIEVEFTTNTDRFFNHEGPKINYSKDKLGDEIHIYPHPLLFEKDIHTLRIDFGKYEDKVVLFSHHSISDLPYDPLAASFYLVSRYEEYLPFKADKFGRFRGEKSIAYSKGFHTEPIVNYYAFHIRDLLYRKYPGMHFSSKEYQFILTYDIDIAFKYSDRGVLRTAGALALAAFKRKWSLISERGKVLSGVEPDPYDTFEQQINLNNKYRVYPIYFFPVGNYGNLDKNISWTSPKLKDTIKKISDRYLMGLHPSYASYNKPRKLELEIARLNAITGKSVVRSRQHYLKMDFPYTYRVLASQGIQEDWTLGYASIIGYRASIATPFYFYDLEKEEQTNLRLFPFAAMDTSLFYYQKLTPQTAFEELKLVVDEAKKVNGTFIFVAHNDLIGPKSIWPGWHKYFEQFIDYARE